MAISREIKLKSRPVGEPTLRNFELTEVELPPVGDGEIRVENHYITVDPYMRGRMIDRESYVPPFALGETMTGGAIGEVVESRHPDFKPGDYVESHYGWREGFVCNAEVMSKVDPQAGSLSAYLGVLGMPGLTAYAGLLRIADLKDGETVFVSGAAGAVGNLVGQIAKVKGCRVIGSAGSEEKVRFLLEECDFDYAFNYKDADLNVELKKGAPEGIDVYFDNVGGDHLEAAINHMRQFGRVAMCGAIANYNAIEATPGPSNILLAISKELTLRGFIVTSQNDLQSQFLSDVSRWIKEGRIKYRETVYEGIESAPEAFMGLFRGENLGKMVVKLK